MAGANKDTIKKCILILIWGITLFGIGFGISFYRGVGKKYDKAVEIPIQEISLENVEDGTYEGEYLFETIYAKVQVTVKNNDIKKVVVEQLDSEKGQEALNIVSSIADADSIMVDDISGATSSSRIIKLAVANALGQ